MISLRKLEIVTYRAGLAVHFTDSVTDQAVTDGLYVQAWHQDPENPRPARQIVLADKSQHSALYGFRSLPGLERYQRGEAVAPETISYFVHIIDQLGRFLPQTRRFDLPLATPATQEIRLFPAPTRVIPTGFGTLSGELVRTTLPEGVPPQVTVIEPAAWAEVSVVVPSDIPEDPPIVVQGFADGHGRFMVVIPYPIIPESMLLSNASWDLPVKVTHSPTAITTDLEELRAAVPSLDPAQTPPFQGTLTNQAGATLYETVTVVDTTTQTYNVVGLLDITQTTVPLRFDQPQVLRTVLDGSAELLSKFFIRSS